MFYDGPTGLLRLVVIGPLAYAWLVLVLRLTGKRTLAQLNAFDFIVTVALGSTLATVVLTDSVALSEGALALAVLAVLQLVVAWLSVRVGWLRRAITSEPTLLLRDGEPLPETMAAQRIALPALHQCVRSAGFGDLAQVGAVVLETNGTISVIGAGSVGSGSVLPET